MKKNIVIALVLALGFATTSFAQENTNQKTIIQNRITYIQNNLTLTGKENQSFWKIYEQNLIDEMKLMDNYRKNLAKQGIKLGSPGTNKEVIAKLSDKQLSYLQDQKYELKKNLLNLETTYYKKYKAFMSPRHLQNLYDLEYKYKKVMTKKKTQEKKEAATAPVNAGKKKR